jgi:hypothetical protein
VVKYSHILGFSGTCLKTHQEIDSHKKYTLSTYRWVNFCDWKQAHFSQPEFSGSVDLVPACQKGRFQAGPAGANPTPPREFPDTHHSRCNRCSGRVSTTDDVADSLHAFSIMCLFRTARLGLQPAFGFLKAAQAEMTQVSGPVVKPGRRYDWRINEDRSAFKVNQS